MPFETPRRWHVDVALVEVALVEVALAEVVLVEVALVEVGVQVALPLPSMPHRRRRQTRWYQ